MPPVSVAEVDLFKTLSRFRLVLLIQTSGISSVKAVDIRFLFGPGDGIKCSVGLQKHDLLSPQQGQPAASLPMTHRRLHRGYCTFSVH